MKQSRALIVLLILGLAMSATVLFSSVQKATPVAGSFNPTGGSTYLLQSSISSSQTTITLTSFTEPGSGIPYTMTYLGSNIEYGTLSPSSGNSEFIAFTNIVQNTNGTATLTGVTRGQARTPGTGGCVASSTLAHAYPGQTQFVLSNTPCFYSQYAVKQNDETISGLYTFTQPPIGINPGGQPNASETVNGVSELATAAESGAGTSVGGTGARLVLPASLATSTPTASCSAFCVAIATAGKLSQSFLNLTQQFNFSSLFATNASSTNATTTKLWITGITNSIVKTDSAGQTIAAVPGVDYSTGSYSFATSTLTIPSTGSISYATSTGLTIPSGTFSASSTIDLVGSMSVCTVSSFGSGSGIGCYVHLRNSAGVDFFRFKVGGNDANTALKQSSFFVRVFNNSSVSSQKGSIVATCITTGVSDTSCSGSGAVSSSINTSGATTLYVVLETNIGGGSANVAATLDDFTITVRP